MRQILKKSDGLWCDDEKIIDIEDDGVRVSEFCPRDLLPVVDSVLKHSQTRDLNDLMAHLREALDQTQVNLAYISLDIPKKAIQALHRTIAPTLELLGLTYNTLNNSHVSIAYTTGKINTKTFNQLMEDLTSFNVGLSPVGIVITRGSGSRLTVDLPKCVQGRAHLPGELLIKSLNESLVSPPQVPIVQ